MQHYHEKPGAEPLNIEEEIAAFVNRPAPAPLAAPKSGKPQPSYTSNQRSAFAAAAGI